MQIKIEKKSNSGGVKIRCIIESFLPLNGAHSHSHTHTTNHLHTGETIKISFVTKFNFVLDAETSKNGSKRIKLGK